MNPSIYLLSFSFEHGSSSDSESIHLSPILPSWTWACESIHLSPLLLFWTWILESLWIYPLISSPSLLNMGLRVIMNPSIYLLSFSPEHGLGSACESIHLSSLLLLLNMGVRVLVNPSIHLLSFTPEHGFWSECLWIHPFISSPSLLNMGLWIHPFILYPSLLDMGLRVHLQAAPAC